LIAHSRPTLGPEDASAVARVLATGQIAQGPETARFEQALAARFGVAAAAAVSSGSSALELALRGLAIAPGDEVVVPTFCCDALWQAVTRVGALPVLADADPVTLSLSAEDTKRRMTSRTRAVIVPHAFGQPVDLDPFLALGVPLVEDCAQTLSRSDASRPVGSRGVVAVGSFYATKLMTTGEGGAVAGARDLVARARAARDYDEQWELAPRFNFKLTDLAAALGLAQLERLDGFLTRRRAIATRYRERLAGAACRLPPAAADHVYHRFVIGIDRPIDAVSERLAARGVAARRPVFRPLHQALGLDGYPEAGRLWATSLSLPCYPALSDDEVDRVAAAVIEVLPT
jgi:dTDP-4-amino-4,6-dideoxygalactose transaminase